MNAQTEILPSEPYAYDATSFDHAAYHGFTPPEGRTRYDGWTPQKQSLFLQALSEGLTITQACAVVGLTRQSAYALRNSPRGAGFALGWDGAVIKAREALVDELMERALKGNRDTVTADDGRITVRHRYDNRLGLAMLSRLDRMADAKGPGIAAAARLVAQDFAQYLELIGRDAGPARAGVFLGARVEPAGDDALAPIRTLARADRWLRTHTDIAEPLGIADLDPAERAGWTAEQWVRAEAAGLVDLAPETPDSSQVGQPLDSDEDELPVWWCSTRECWLTNFPPPEDYQGYEVGHYGDAAYSRTVTDAEQAVLDAQEGADTATRQVAGARARDRYFGFAADVDADADGAEAEAAAETPDSADEPPAPSDAPRRRARATAHPQAVPCVEPPSAPFGARTGVFPMSIFGSIKDAIFGHPKAAAPAAPAPAAAQPPGQAPAMPQMQQAPAAPAAAPAPVDVETVLMVFETERGTADLNWRTSIVDLMKLLGLDSSLDNRKQLATELGYTGAKDGSAEMNIWLQKAVMQELARNGGNVPASLKD